VPLIAVLNDDPSAPGQIVVYPIFDRSRNQEYDPLSVFACTVSTRPFEGSQRVRNRKAPRTVEVRQDNPPASSVTDTAW